MLMTIFVMLMNAASPPTYPLSLHDALPIFSSSGLAKLTQGCSGATPVSENWLRVEDQNRSFADRRGARRSEEHTSELQSRVELVCRLLLEKKNAQGFAFRLTLKSISLLENP